MVLGVKVVDAIDAHEPKQGHPHGSWKRAAEWSTHLLNTNPLVPTGRDDLATKRQEDHTRKDTAPLTRLLAGAFASGFSS